MQGGVSQEGRLVIWAASGPVAQLDRVPRFERGGCGFKPCRDRHIDFWALKFHGFLPLLAHSPKCWAISFGSRRIVRLKIIAIPHSAWRRWQWRRRSWPIVPLALGLRTGFPCGLLRLPSASVE